MASIVNADNGSVSGSAGLKSSADSSGVLALQTNGTTAVTISTGQVATFAQAPVLPAASIPQAALAAGVAGTGPAFSAYQSTAQTALASNTATKLLFQTEEFDTNSSFNNTASTVGSTPAYAFLPTVAGYYQVNAAFTAGVSYSFGQIYLYKNTFLAKFGNSNGITSNNSNGWTISALIYMNGTTDYLEVYALSAVSQAPATGTPYTYFQAFLARSA